jgi:hypothetical protein
MNAPLAAGQGAPSVVAAGEGAVPLTLEEAFPLVSKATSTDDLIDIAKRIRPVRPWANDDELNPGLLGKPLEDAKDWLETQIDSDIAASNPQQGGRKPRPRRKTRKSKRKHFRKRTSRRH